MNFLNFQNKLELYLNENSKKWFLPELNAQTKILLIMLIFPIIIYLLARRKQYHPYFYSLDSANNIKYVKKTIDKIGQGSVQDLSSAAKFAIIDGYGNGIVITENNLYYYLTPKALSFNQGERGSIALDQIKGISIEKFSNVAKLTLNNNPIGILRMYKIERLDRFLKHMMDILYKQLDHKV